MRLIANPPNPYLSSEVEWLDAPPARLTVYEEQVKSIISENDSPDIGFSFSVNPYRGCFHGCAYCYARPTHHYLDFGAGTDFERKLVVKINAPKLLRQELRRTKLRDQTIIFSGVTDCYQPLEASYGITRSCLEVCHDAGNPVGIITKGALVARDVELLARMNQRAGVTVYISVPFAEDSMARKIEPYAPAPSTRLRAMKILSAAGIPVGVAVSPLIPGLNDRDIPTILERAKEVGATKAFMTLLRLPSAVGKVFQERIQEAIPEKAQRIFSQIKDLRGGAINSAEFGQRMQGKGPRWNALSWLFESNCQRLGFNTAHEPRREPYRAQLTLL